MAINFKELFPINKPIIGMIHLAGNTHSERVRRALEELVLYEEEEVDGAIIEDYHGTKEDVQETLKQSSRELFKITRGVNLLSNPYLAFELASESGARFVQFDSIQTADLNLEIYNQNRQSYPDMLVLGGVSFKYIRPTGNPIERDLDEGRIRCEAIVTTGAGTGIETPLEKLILFKRYLGDFPLIVGAGFNAHNAYKQLACTDGAIVGSYFKPNRNIELPVDKALVRNLMNAVKQIRKISLKDIYREFG